MSLNSFNYSFEKNTVTKKYIVPKKIVTTCGAVYTELLTSDTPRQPTIGNADVCTIQKEGYVVLDFGCELHGGVDITINKLELDDADKENEFCKYGKMRIVFGESVSEVLSSVGDDKKAQNDHSVRDMTVITTSFSSTRYGNTGFRFVKIESLDSCLELGCIKGVFEYKDIEYKGSFRCNDQRLNDIFETAVYTVHLNMQDYIWNGIKHDRLVWIGDMHPEVATICSVFGYDESVEKTLDFARDSYPITDDASPVWMVFPSYTCWWITIHHDWYMQNGRLDYLKKPKDYMYKICKNLLNGIDTDGGLHFDEKYFVDWSSEGTPWMEAGFRGCLIMALDAASEIFKVYGDFETSDKCINAILNVKKIKPDFSGNKQMTAMAALAGLCDIKDAERVITKNLLEGLSTFYGYYVLNALSKAGNMQSAIDIMKDYWGAMLDLGATTFWEDFDIEWVRNAGRIDELPNSDKVDVHANYGKFCYRGLRHSLCHGWSGGPADFMIKNIIGVKILEAGCQKIAIEPKLGDIEWVKGTYPTPFGIIEIEHKKENGKIKSEIKAPDGVHIIK